MPEVSIILPTHNRPVYLKRAIESVIAQTFKDWKLIIISRTEGPEDPTREVIKGFQEKSVPIQFVEELGNGVSAARNRGLAIAKSPYIAFLDDDDYWFPNKLKDQFAFMDSHPEIGMSYSRLRIIEKKHGVTKTILYPEVVASGFLELLYDCFILSSTVMVRKSCLDEVGIFNPQYKISEDQDLWLRFSQRFEIFPMDGISAETVMDNRGHLAQDPIAVRENMITVLKNLEFTEKYKRHFRLKERHIARIRYELGRDYFDLRKYWDAAKYFALSLVADPFVGLMVRTPKERGLKLALRVVKAYFSVPFCLLKGLLYAAAR